VIKVKQIELILVAVVLTSIFSIASASDTTTKFKTGPFSVSVDLGMPCNDTNISKPVSSEDLGGNSYTDYDTNLCNAEIWIRQWGKDTTQSFDLISPFSTSDINSGLLGRGADKDTITIFARKIDGKPAAAGKGYVSKFDKWRYIAGFHISSKSYCYIWVWGNETTMISALKTIHVTEAAT